MKLRGDAVDLGLLAASASSALTCSSAEKTGLRTSRFRSALSATISLEPVEIGPDLVERLLLEREIEKRGRVAPRHPGNNRLFACH